MFKPGDKVKCIDGGPFGLRGGETYTVKAVNGHYIATEESTSVWTVDRFALASEEQITCLSEKIAERRAELDALEKQHQDILKRQAFREPCVWNSVDDFLDVSFDDDDNLFRFEGHENGDGTRIYLTKEKALALAAYIQKKVSDV